MNYLEQYESVIRLGMFGGVFLLMAVLETIAPRRHRELPRGRRWLTNSSLVVVNTLVLRTLFPLLALGMAELTLARGWGLFSIIALPFWLQLVVTIIALDLLVYFQHRAFHKLPLFWRFHKVHHADRDFDVTTGVRFHPIEIVFSMLVKMCGIAMLGAPLVGVLIFEVLLNASAMFNHANLRLPKKLDSVLRKLVVTPDFHRVHHSVIRAETNSNYGFFLSVWDYVFNSYTAQPRDGHENMTIGLAQYQTQLPAALYWNLLLPFSSRDSAAAKE